MVGSQILGVALLGLSSLISSTQHIGHYTYGNETIDSIDVVGVVKLNGTKILNDLKITGTLTAQSAYLHDVEVIGNCCLIDTIIETAMHITGPLQAMRSQFRSALILVGQRGVFTNCELQGITVQRDVGFKAKQQLELREGTIVNGSITFEQGNGEVLLYPDSKIYGPISGGRLVYK